ncbi:hypothetical protein RhiJN_27451 [Ceratobasidium sp. AG-Ba]|nr:hypothetical protein RhiJN_27451 [Ceratobasidium sp. AG-Ba]
MTRTVVRVEWETDVQTGQCGRCGELEEGFERDGAVEPSALEELTIWLSQGPLMGHAWPVTTLPRAKKLFFAADERGSYSRHGRVIYAHETVIVCAYTHVVDESSNGGDVRRDGSTAGRTLEPSAQSPWRDKARPPHRGISHRARSVDDAWDALAVAGSGDQSGAVRHQARGTEVPTAGVDMGTGGACA